MQKVILILMSITCCLALEMWWNVEGTKFGFDKYFRKNLEQQRELPNNSEKKKQLIEYFTFNKKAKYDLEDHNSRTDFYPKHLEERVIIPYDTHIIWVTTPKKMKVMNFKNIWDMIHKMGQEKKKNGVDWKHYFWTNDRRSVYINETVCEGRCHIRLFNELPGYDQVSFLVDQLIKVKYFAIDFLKPYIIYNHGGVYIDTDYNYFRSFRFLHTVMDSYTGSEGTFYPGLAAGIFAARKKHQAMKDWLDFLLGYYGLAPDVFGCRDLMPMPTFRDDISWTSGPRAFTFSIWANLNKWGNNDAVFKMSLINQDATHSSWKYQKFYGILIDDNPRRESITIGGQKYHFEQFGFQDNIGSWHLPSDASFKLADGRTQKQFWIMDLSDTTDIMSPNYVTNETLQAERERYSGLPLVQQIFFDEWFSAYFKMQSGRYIDNMMLPEQKQNHGELLDDGKDINSAWTQDFLEVGTPDDSHKQEKQEL